MAELPEPSQPDHLRMRVSDSERQRVADLLSVAVGDGRLGVGEYEDRIAGVWSATTRADLVPLVSDLVPEQAWQQSPTSAATRSVVPSGELGPKRSVGILSSFQLRGNWRVPGTVHALAFLGSGQIDLRQAVFTTREVTISAVAILGGIEVIASPEVSVVTSGAGVMGGFSSTDHIADDPNAPRIRVGGFALLGGIDIKIAEIDDHPDD